MNASTIIDDQMTLEEKLAAIDKALLNAQAVQSDSQTGAAPIDPASLTICDGCE